MSRKEDRPSAEPVPDNLNFPQAIYRPVPNSTSDPEVHPATYRTWARTQFVNRLRSRRRISRELDQVCGVEHFPLKRREVVEDGGDFYTADIGDHYRDMGLVLGFEERRAAGLAMLEWERAA